MPQLMARCALQSGCGDNPHEHSSGKAERTQGAETYLLCRRFLNDDHNEEENRHQWR
jgi:hypothetical protein